MRRAAALLVLFASCEWRGPTEPAAASRPAQRTTVLEEPLFKMDPKRLTLSPGMSATVPNFARPPESHPAALRRARAAFHLSAVGIYFLPTLLW